MCHTSVCLTFIEAIILRCDVTICQIDEMRKAFFLLISMTAWREKLTWPLLTPL